MESHRSSHRSHILLTLRRNSDFKIINKIVRQLLREGLVLALLVRRHNLRQRGVCLAKPSPHPSPLNLRSVVVPLLLDPLVLPLEQGLVGLASSNHSNNNNHSRHSSSLRVGSVGSVKLNHNNRPASALAVSVTHNHNNRPAVSSVPPLLVKSPLPLDLVLVFS